MILPIGILLFGGVLIYAGLHNMSVTDVIRQGLGRSPKGGLGSLMPASASSSSGTSGATSSVGGSLGAGGKTAYSHLQLGRLDQGVDFTGSGPVGAIADGTVVHVGLWPGWPGDGGVVYHTQYGNIYVMEHFHPSVHVGQHVKAGDVIGEAPGGYPWIETGFANASATGPLTPYNGAPDGTVMPGARKFKQLLGI